MASWKSARSSEASVLRKAAMQCTWVVLVAIQSGTTMMMEEHKRFFSPTAAASNWKRRRLINTNWKLKSFLSAAMILGVVHFVPTLFMFAHLPFLRSPLDLSLLFHLPPRDLNDLAEERLTKETETRRQLIRPLHKEEDSTCSYWRGVIPPGNVSRYILAAKAPRGILVTLVLGQGSQDSLCRFFPSQWDKAILPQGWDVLLVVGRTFKDKPATIQQRKDALISCLKLQQLPRPPQIWNNLDGSTLLTQEYQVSLTNSTYQSINHINKIFLAETELLLPHYIQANQSLLKVPMIPKQCQAPIPYILGTKWYVDQMLHLSILRDYDYFLKLDTDVVFLKPIPTHLLNDMTIRRAIFGHTGQYPDHVEAPCGTGITKAVEEFLKQQQQTIRTINPSPSLPCSQGHPALSKDADLYYTNFIVARTDFFQSPAVLELSRFLADYPEGFFRYRWTDQIFWHFAMGLFVAGAENRIEDSRPSWLQQQFPQENRAFEDAVVDYSQFRCAPQKNCWMSVHYYNHDRCDNGGIFFHTKAKQPPANNSKWSWQEEFSIEGELLDVTSLRHSSVPFETQYQDQCKQMSV